MSPIDRYLTQTAAEVAKDDAQARDRGDLKTTLEQRIAVALMEARALECNYTAGEIRLKTNNPTLLQFARALDERKHKLTARAIEMCKIWPIHDEDAGKVVIN